jgi:hypothetical protein
MLEKLKNYLEDLPYSPKAIAAFFGGFTFLFRLPFVFRYDLFFGSDPGICYLMPWRVVHGDRPFYFYSETHQGATESYVTALLFKLFGPSIQLAAAQSLLIWSIAVALGVYLFIRSTSKFHGIFAGLVAAIGVPYTLIYVTVPYIGYPGSFLITILLLLQAFFILEKGHSPLRIFLFSFVIGSGLFIGKQCIPGIGAAFLAFLLFQTPTCNIRKFLNLRLVLLASLGFLLGYSPEICYRVTHTYYRDFSGLATFKIIGKNIECLVKGLMAYFNANRFSRIPTDIYFYHSIPYGDVHPHTIFDFLFAAMGLAVLFFSYQTLKRSFSEKNIGLFLLTSLIFVNIVAVVISATSIGNIFNVRRYLHVSAISLSLFTGYFFTFYLVKVKHKFLNWGLLLFGALFLIRTTYDEYSLLRLPNGLREFRWIIQDMKQRGFTRGISFYGPNYLINALSNEEIIIGGRDGDLIAEYPDLISQVDKIAVIGYKGDPIEDQVSFNGNNYKRIGEARLDELIRWVPYQKIPKLGGIKNG